MIAITLLDHFGVTAGDVPVELPASTHRLIALLALRPAPAQRSYASRCLWLDKTEFRSYANLRSVLWRLRQCQPPLVIASPSHLSLVGDVRVDVLTQRRLAHALIDESQPADLASVDVTSLSGELLPDWSDDFVELERERLRQIRLHAMEALARRLLRAGRYALALDAALTAVASDPLRESAHRAVIEVHVAEGNFGEALRQFSALRSVLAREFGIAPSRQTADLVARPPALI